jgi:glycosyltransferase involved in cell wall biosynthesis
MATRWLYKSACWKVVTTGERLRQALMVEAGLPPEHLVSVPTGIDLSRFSPARVPRQDGKRLLGLPENALVLGIAATLRSWKGHDYLLEALSRLAAEMPRVRLLVAGDGPRRQHIESRIAELGVGDKVLMLGQRSDMPEVLAAMDVFVLPSYANEGVPQAIMQAMAMALPVVSTRVGAIDEAVIHEETGLLVEPRNPDALAEALSHLLSDEALRSRMGDAGRRRALERFSIQHMADRMEDIFRAAANA